MRHNPRQGHSGGVADYVDAVACEVAPDLARTKLFRTFLRDLEAPERTKEGRFYRVRFKTGAVVDLVPPGSLAAGWRLVRGKGRTADRYELVAPAVGRLWEAFLEKNR